MEFPGQGLDLNCCCDLHCSFYGNTGSFNAVCWPGDWTCILELQRCHWSRCTTAGTPKVFSFLSFFLFFFFLEQLLAFYAFVDVIRWLFCLNLLMLNHLPLFTVAGFDLITFSLGLLCVCFHEWHWLMVFFLVLALPSFDMREMLACSVIWRNHLPFPAIWNGFWYIGVICSLNIWYSLTVWSSMLGAFLVGLWLQFQSLPWIWVYSDLLLSPGIKFCNLYLPRTICTLSRVSDSLA